MRSRRRALACYAVLALAELVEAVAFVWTRGDQARVARLAGWFGLSFETELARLNLLMPVALVLSLVAWVALVGVSRGILRASRRAALILCGLYAIWALVQQLVLSAPEPAGRVWLLWTTFGIGGLAVAGYVNAGRAMSQPDDGEPFHVYDPGLKRVASQSGLEWQDVDLGLGPLAAPGRTAVVHYTGWLTDGRKFDSSRDRGKPFEFTVGSGRVIRGWDEGVSTMRQGGRRRLIVPPSLGYGAAGAGAIPGGATLLFDVELVDVR